MDDVSIRDRDGDRDRTHAHARARDLEFVADRARATLARSLARSLDRPTLRCRVASRRHQSIIHRPTTRRRRPSRVAHRARVRASPVAIARSALVPGVRRGCRRDDDWCLG